MDENIDKEIKKITLCVGWEYCKCNNCKLARLYLLNPNYRDFIIKIKENLKTSHNNDFSKDLDVKELKRRRKELIDHPERGIELKDL